MPAIALAKGYSKRSENLPIRLFNMFYEVDPTNIEDQVSLISRHGLSPVGDAGAGFIAGLIRREDSNDSIIGVSGEFVFAVTGSGVSAGGGGVSGADRVRMATDGVNTFIVRSGKLYNLPDGSPVAEVEMPDDRAVYDVVFLSGSFWIVSEDGRVYFTLPGEVTVNALSYFTAESSPDTLIGIGVDSDQLVLFGRSSIEYWTLTGDPDLPAQRIIGRRSKAGLAGVHSLTEVGDLGLAWVGDDGIVYRSGSLPAPISDPTIVEAIRLGRPLIDDSDPATTLSGWSYTMDQHVFYVLDVPGQGTFAFDFTTGQWSEFGTVDQPLFMVGCAAKRRDGEWIVGGTFDSKVRAIDPSVYNDAGVPLVRRFPGLTRTKANLPIANVQVECSTGGAGLEYPGDNPKLAMRYSDDGNLWSNWDYADLGRQGRFLPRPRFAKQRGQRPGTRIWEWRMSDDIPFTAHAASYNEPVV